MPIMDRIDARVARQRLLDHPFYTAWSEGRLSLDALRLYAEQYYHWTAAFPTFLSLTHAQCPSLAARQTILANLVDEEMGPDNHPELWLRFCDTLGLDRQAVMASERLPETSAAIDALRSVCSSEPYAAGLAALYAYESQQPEVMKTKRLGLSEMYGIHSGHDFFVEHETADITHSLDEARLIESASAGVEDEILAATDVALGATYLLLDGVYNRAVAD